ncbi:Uncharacterized protein APZ42_018240 [Daphnia magna]|uniref:Uncharacterized protein n=2 Tax=Daphnia magna TaxID=35525 RepID=A0ABQ9YV32_9CRUS|nr:hypothetical protein OUZ56_006251 [Daphnia magna]KZS16126.1 Uncharacterized protein APZ42_018240 [Daphnia magna]
MLSYSALLVVSSVAVMLMDNGVEAQNTYFYRRFGQSNPSVSRNVFRPQNPSSAFNINPVVARSNNGWGWPSAVQQQNRWRVNFDNSIEDNSVESVESTFRRRSSSPQRPSIPSNAWNRPTAAPVRQQQTRWNVRHSDEDSFESRENRRWW